MLKIQGLDRLTKQLSDAQKALEGVDGELGGVSFDPTDPASIESAISQIEAMVDEKLGAYSSNPLIGPWANEMKEAYRQQLLERAARARLESKKE
jgi:hypothetical protein